KHQIPRPFRGTSGSTMSGDVATSRPYIIAAAAGANWTSDQTQVCLAHHPSTCRSREQGMVRCSSRAPDAPGLIPTHRQACLEPFLLPTTILANIRVAE